MCNRYAGEFIFEKQPDCLSITEANYSQICYHNNYGQIKAILTAEDVGVSKLTSSLACFAKRNKNSISKGSQ